MEANRKRAKVHRLPTEDKSQIWIGRLGLAFMKDLSKPIKGAEGIPQHLYITTDEEIKEGDWVYWTDPEGLTSDINQVISINEEMIFLSHPEHSETEALPSECRKIIASTDPKLLPRREYEGLDETAQNQYRIIKGLPQPSQAFIKAYCKQGGIDEVDVEYFADWDDLQYSEFGEYAPRKLKVDPIHNTIIIHRVIFNRRDDLLRAICIYTEDSISKALPFVEEWIKDNPSSYKE